MKLTTLSAVVTIALLTGCNATVTPAASNGHKVQQSPIQHVVILIEENRSFNSMFAGFPGADTVMHGLCKAGPAWCKVAHQVPLQSIRLKSGPKNRGVDIDHSHYGFKIECDANASSVCQNDGFNLINYGESGQGTPAKNYPYAYVDHTETAPYWRLAKAYTLADRMFSTDSASSFIAHQQLIAGTVAISKDESLTDQPNNTPWGCDAPGPHGKKRYTWTPVLYKGGHYNAYGPFPCFSQYSTVADLLDAAQVSYSYYVADMFSGPNYDFSGAVWNGFDAIKKVACPTTHPSGTQQIVCDRGPDWSHIKIPNTRFFNDVSSGKLAQLSYVIPTLYDSDHPASGCNGGPRWITKVVNTIGTSQYWKDTAIILVWDDWGGWYDNVPPPQVNYTSLGFRVPMIVMSPYARHAYISHTVYNFGSILKFIEETFRLGSLGTTDASSNSMTDIFDFSQKPLPFRQFTLPPADACADHKMDSRATHEIIQSDGGLPE